MPNIKNQIPDNYNDLAAKVSNYDKKQIHKIIQDKYVKPIKKREKIHKKNQLNEWFWTKGATIINIILALIAAITGIISLLK